MFAVGCQKEELNIPGEKVTANRGPAKQEQVANLAKETLLLKKLTPHYTTLPGKDDLYWETKFGRILLSRVYKSETSKEGRIQYLLHISPEEANGE
ncbi:hypothetical protein AB9P05_05985 [Roseivirga sp. BDSF3-8]|uniref:hypothetical protein n=1 Tax=Roseivirga sp. BDSF3-8 TaxID=3241598 RepID=UPI003531FE00